VMALRLQALAAVNGLSVYVPPAYTRQTGSTILDPRSGATLRDSDVVLGVITAGVSEACQQELNTAKEVGKKTIVIAEPTSAPWLKPYFPGNLVLIDPSDPGGGRASRDGASCQDSADCARYISTGPSAICSPGVIERRPWQSLSELSTRLASLPWMP